MSDRVDLKQMVETPSCAPPLKTHAIAFAVLATTLVATLTCSPSESSAYFAIGPDTPNPWWASAIDPTGPQAAYISLELDANDNPCVSFYDAENRDLKYAVKAGGYWTIETVDAAGDVGAAPSLALDSAGNPHISYYDATNMNIKYASQVGGVWTLEVVEETQSSPSSIALDGQGRPHICYPSRLAFEPLLRYAVKSGGAWSYETVENPVGNFDGASLVLDRAGDAHIAYVGYVGALPYVRYAHKSSGLWTFETADGSYHPSPNTNPSLALDEEGNPSIAYCIYCCCGNEGRLGFASRSGGLWQPEIVDQGSLREVGFGGSLKLDGLGAPHVSYFDYPYWPSGVPPSRFKYAKKSGGLWAITVLDSGDGGGGGSTSLEVDSHGNPRIGYYDIRVGHLKYASTAVELRDPSPGTTWPVGASRAVTWDGTGSVDLFLSTDGGNSWQPQETGLIGGKYRWIVPHTPTKFAQVKLERALPASRAKTPGIFTIETSVALLALLAAPVPERMGVAMITWSTDPGPTDLAGYRLEKSSGVTADWRTLVSLTRETSYTDEKAGLGGSRYRLFAINGLGEELWLGETSLKPLKALAAWPLPYREGSLAISFATAGGLGGGRGKADVAVFDVAGRLVRRIASGDYPAGFQAAIWDGRDRSGHRVPSGIYFLRSSSGGEQHTVRLSVLR